MNALALQSAKLQVLIAVAGIAVASIVVADYYTLAPVASGSNEPVQHEHRAHEMVAAQDDCIDDVRIANWGPGTASNYLDEPPDYSGDDEIWIYYEIENHSCQEITATVEVRGSQSRAIIRNLDDSLGHCLPKCTIDAWNTTHGAGYYGGGMKWDLANHPAVNGEYVVITVTITGPAGFTDTDLSNNSSRSEDFINVVSDEPAAPEVDVALTSVTPSHTNAPIGTSIVFTAVITNNGTAPIAPSLTLFTDDEDTVGASTPIDAIEPGESGSADLVWNTAEAMAGTYAPRVVLTAVDDASTDDNEWSASITLRDAVVDVRLESVDPTAITAPAGESVGLTVTVSNRGDFAAVPMVELYIYDELAPVVSVPMASIVPGDEGTVELTWDTTAMAAGDYQLKVSVRPDAATAEPTAVRSIEAVLYYPVDVAVTSAVVANPPTIAGASVTVRVTVENLSENDAAQVAVAMTIRGETEPLATGIIAPLPAGNSAVLDLEWDTTGRVPAQYDPRVVATTKWDTNDSNDRQSVNIVLRNWATMTEATRNASGVIGDTIQLSAHVLNHGPSALENLTVGLYNSDDTALATTAISSIAAGATEIATLNWDTSEQEVGIHELYASVDSPGIGSDVDDTTLVTVTLHNEITLTGVRQSPDDAVVGQPVAVVAELVNQSNHTVARATVRLVDDNPDGGGQSDDEIAAATVAELEPGTSQEVSLGWDSSGSTAGTYDYWVTIDIADRAEDANDALPITVSLRDPVVDVALTGATSSHSIAIIGQAITITATVANNGEAPLSVPVSLFVAPSTAPGSTPTSKVVTNTPVIQPGVNETVDLIWDTAELNGVGEYPLLVVAQVPGDISDDNDEITLVAELFHSAFDADHPASECVDDVGVELTGIYDDVNVKSLNTPAIYSREDRLFITYRIFNYSCDKDVTAGLTLTGSGSGAAISDQIDPCLSGCFIPAGGMTNRFVRWQLLDYPVVIGEMIEE